MSTVLNARYYYTPLPACLLPLDNLLGYRGPTTVKPALCLESITWGLGAWVAPARDYIAWWRYLPSCPAPINSPESSVTSGEADWTVRGAQLYHALRTSQVRASGPDPCFLRGLGSNHISRVLAAHLDNPEPRSPQDRARGPEPPKIPLYIWNSQLFVGLTYLSTIL